jgi:hypothetical protein
MYDFSVTGFSFFMSLALVRGWVMDNESVSIFLTSFYHSVTTLYIYLWDILINSDYPLTDTSQSLSRSRSQLLLVAERYICLTIPTCIALVGFLTVII